MSQPLIIHCPQCGAALSVTDEYLAQYAGQSTTCANCRQQFVIPSEATMPAAAQTLAYATPYAAQNDYYKPPIFCDSGGLVVHKRFEGLDQCVKCNAPAEGYRWRKNMYWHHPALFFLIFAGILIYAIVALVVRKSGQVSVGLCPIHRAARVKKIIIAWTICLFGIAMMIIGPVIASNMRGNSGEHYALVGVLGGIVVLLGGLIFTAVGVAVVTPRKIDDNYVYLNRAGQPFLNTLQRL